MAESRLERVLRPRYVFFSLAVLLILAVLTTPENSAPDEAPRLTTYGRGDPGARGLYDLLSALGLTTDRRLLPWKGPLDSAATYVVLAPLSDPSAREVTVLLDAVRRGAGLIVVAENGPPLSDSLGLRRSFQLGRPLVSADTLFGSADLEQEARRFKRYLRGAPRSEKDSTRVFPRDTVTLVSASHGDSVRPVIMGRRLGRGRVVLIADPTFLSNAVMRHGDAAVLALRLLEWIDPSRRWPVVFDEYHQGFGRHADLMRTVLGALVEHPAGRVLLQLVAAALLLVFALSVRPIAPPPVTIIERRSPLEHVGALSRAYARVTATRLSVHRLVRGLRRRHPMGAAGALDDAAYLERVRARTAGVGKDIDLLRQGLQEQLPVADFVRVGAAIDHIERTLTS